MRYLKYNYLQKVGGECKEKDSKIVLFQKRNGGQICA